MKSELPDPIAETLKDTADEARVSRMWRGIEAREQKARGRRSPMRVVAPVALAAAAVAVAWIAWPKSDPSVVRAPGALHLEDGAALRASGGPRTLRLDDGSRITLSEGARIVPMRNDGRTLTLLLARGRARFEVEPHGPRTWSIESGVATVEVVGTVFTVERGDGWARVEVEHGVVVVRGERVPDRVARLTRGESILVGERHAAQPMPTAPSEPRPSATRDPEPRPRARENASPAPVREDAEALMARADAARRDGRMDDAVELLTRAMADDADPAAGVAAFTLGRLELDVLHHADRAASAFDRALSLTLPPRLREDASARLVDARLAADQLALAERAADAYLRAYPEGRHVERIRLAIASARE
jgi:transmembrane sensor